MLNFNGKLVPPTHPRSDHRGLQFGDGVFETVRILDGKVLFLEDHYFRLMSSMRIVRMEIPMEFTMEFIEAQLLATAESENCAGAARARITVYRTGGGLYLPQTNDVDWLITASALESKLYAQAKTPYEVELFKDFYVTRQLLSTVKSTNRLINITGSIFAAENGFDNCLLMNDAKNIIEALNGNVFLLAGNKLVTPPVSEGCLNGVMRKQVLALAKRNQDLEVAEEIISPFDLQKADELFMTNVITGIQPITRYRKKTYATKLSGDLLVQLNAQLRLG